MALEIQGEVGRARYGNADGTNVSLRMGKTGELSVGITHGLNFEAASRGNVYSAVNTTGVTTQAGLSATTPALTLYNPLGSGVVASIIYAGCINTVAFAAASVIYLAANTNLAAAAVTGTITTNGKNSLLGNQSTSKIQALTAATLPTTPTAVAILGVGLTGAITTTPSYGNVGRYFDGQLVLLPGSAISFQTSTASGASGFFGEIVWEEIPLI